MHLIAGACYLTLVSCGKFNLPPPDVRQPGKTHMSVFDNVLFVMRVGGCVRLYLSI